MPTPVLAADLLLGVSNPKALERAVADMFSNAVAEGVNHGMKGELGDIQKRLQKAMYTAHINSLKLQDRKEAENLKLQYKRKLDQIKAYYAEVKKQEEEIRQSEERGDAESLRRQYIEEKNRLEQLIRQEQRAIEDNIDRLNHAQKDRMKLLNKGMEQAAEGLGKNLETYADKFESAMGKALSVENLNLADLTKNIGRAFADGAPAMMRLGAQGAAKGETMGGGMGGAMMLLGKSAMALSAAAAPIAGVAAVLGTLVGLFVAADGQAKEFNKSILEGSSAVDLLGTQAVGNSRALSQALDEVRESAMDVSLEFRMSTEEIMAFTRAMNESNVTYREQVKVFGSTGNAMRQALVASQAFGVSGSEVAKMINDMTTSFAYGQNEIAAGFQDIFGAAQMSGMGVRNFFSAVSEATSGMALYNFRLSDTLELMIGLEKLLGEDLAKQALSNSAGKFKEMGYQERLGFRMKMGGGLFKDIAGIETNKAQKEFNRKFESLPEDLRNALAEKAPGAISATGVDARALAKMSGTQIGSLQNMMRDAGFGEMAIQLGNMRRVGKGGGSMMGEAGAETSLAMDLSGAIGYLGNVLISDMSEIQKMAFEQNQGISGTMLKTYEEIQNAVGGRLSSQGKDASAASIARAIAEGGILTEDEQKRLAEVQRDASKSMEEVARTQLTETTGILQELKNRITPLLEGVYDLLNRFTDGPSIRESRTSMEAAQKAAKGFGSFDESSFSKMGESIGLMGPALEQFVQEQRAEFDAKKAAAQRRATFEEAAYNGALEGKSRNDVLGSMTAGMSESQRISLGLAKKTTTRIDAQTGMGGDEYVKAITADQLTEDQLDAVLSAISGSEIAESQKDAKAQVLATEQVTEGVKDLKDVLIRQGLEDITGFAADQQNYGRNRMKIMEEGVTAQEAAAFNRAYGLTGDAALRPSVDDFIYRGNGGSGTITPIHKSDEFYGAKPGGPIANGVGRSVVINNLTINESGDPKKTLQMVKQAIAAASGE